MTYDRLEKEDFGLDTLSPGLASLVREVYDEVFFTLDADQGELHGRHVREEGFYERVAEIVLPEKWKIQRLRTLYLNNAPLLHNWGTMPLEDKYDLYDVTGVSLYTSEEEEALAQYEALKEYICDLIHYVVIPDYHARASRRYRISGTRIIRRENLFASTQAPRVDSTLSLRTSNPLSITPEYYD